MMALAAAALGADAMLTQTPASLASSPIAGSPRLDRRVTADGNSREASAIHHAATRRAMPCNCAPTCARERSANSRLRTALISLAPLDTPGSIALASRLARGGKVLLPGRTGP